MWAIDLTHTSHTSAQTGIQQVSRSLYAILSSSYGCKSVIYDRFAGCWRNPDRSEQGLISGVQSSPSGKRSASWSPFQKLRGILTRKLLKVKVSGPVKGMFFPEIIDRQRTATLFTDNYSASLQKVALFHDAIPIKFPQWCAAETVAHFPDYLHCLSRFDHVACVSETSRTDLLEQWHRLNLEPVPTSVVHLGVPRVSEPKPAEVRNSRPVVLSIGTIEQRKNHIALLKAAEELWTVGIQFELVIAGMANTRTSSEALALIKELAGKGRCITWTGPVCNAEMDTLLDRADLMAYPSLYEGFGLPVLEALAHGKPVLTTNNGALQEHTAGGGCMVCDGSIDGIRNSLQALLTDRQMLADLAAQARQREIRTMTETAGIIAGILDQVSQGKSSSS